MAVSVPGAVGAWVSVGTGLTGAFMSCWIWAAVSAFEYTRTSSIRPANHSEGRLLPPIRRAPVDVTIGPVRFRLDA